VRFQVCWYGWRAPWLRLFWERWPEDSSWGRIFSWRLAVGPLDIRRWRS
jgi:hypothetical protein